MERSGWVSKRRRAGSPTMMPPSGSMLTTDGHSVLPDGPGIHLGSPVCASTYATKLFVVPRSMPTIFPMKSCQLPVIRFQLEPGPTTTLQQFLLNVHYQIANVRAAIQKIVELSHDLCARAFIHARFDGSVPFLRFGLQRAIDVLQLLFKII